jgi:hypothetical protein
MFLYTVAFGYPNTPTEQDKESFKSLIHSLPDLLPCEMCRHNLSTKLDGDLGARLDDAVLCSEKLVRYVYDLEAAVAEKNGKPMKPFNEVVRGVMSNTYKQATTTHVSRASNESAGGGGTSQLTLLWILLPVAVVVTLVVTWLTTKKILGKK